VPRMRRHSPARASVTLSATPIEVETVLLIGNPYDNAKCESFMKTLKQEEIYTREYRDRADLEVHIGHFLEQYYNRWRLHSALNYRSPERFEQSLKQTSTMLPPAGMSFFRHEEIYRPDVAAQAREEER